MEYIITVKNLKKKYGKVDACGYELGVDDSQIRNNIGVVFQTGVLDGRLTINENLLLHGAFYGLKRKKLERRLTDIADITGISDILDRKYNKLSGGQKRRADIESGNAASLKG